MTIWQLQDAKDRLDEVIERALTEGPQVITRHGVEVVVVIPCSGFREMVASQTTLADFFLNSPLRGSKLDLSRDRSAKLRDIEL